VFYPGAECGFATALCFSRVRIPKLTTAGLYEARLRNFAPSL